VLGESHRAGSDTSSACLTIKHMCYRRGDGSFILSPTIPLLRTSRGRTLGSYTYSTEPYRMDFSLVKVDLAQRKYVAERN
jgi:hypothetical protein